MSPFEALFCSFVIVSILTIIVMIVISIIVMVRHKKGKMISFREQHKFDEYCSKIKKGVILCKVRKNENPFNEPNIDRIKILERRDDWVQYAYETTPTLKEILKTEWTDYYKCSYPIETLYRLGYKIEENH